jgi:hypothetical protein
MISFLFILYYSIATIATEFDIGYASAIKKDGKLYVYDTYDETLATPAITVYQLKDGPIKQLKNSTIKISNIDENYTPQFLHIPQGLPDGRSDQIWMLGGRKVDFIKSNEFDSKHWAGQLVDGKELKFDSSFIKVPDFPNFPKGGYSQTIVNYNNTFELYIIGGYIYSKKYKDQVMTNYVFKYDFNTDTWSEKSENSKKVLPPIATHRAVFVNDFILVGIGISPGYLNFDQTSKPKDYINANAIEKLYKLDLRTQTWELKMPNINLDRAVFDVGFSVGASLDLYKNKIITYGSFNNFQQEGEILQLGTLDYSTPQWDWKWDKVTNNNQKNNLNVKYHQTVIFNNQMLIINGKLNTLNFIRINNLFRNI